VAQQYQVDIVTKVVGASSIAKLEKSLDKIAAKQNKADKAFQKSVNNLKKLNGAYKGSAKQADDVARSLDRLKNAAIQAQSRGFNKLQTGMQNMQGAFFKFAGAIAGAKLAVDGFVNVLQAGFQRDVSEQKLKNLSTSADEYKRSLDFVKESADKFLITQTSATEQFGDLTARLKPLGVEMQGIENVFTSLNYLAAQNGVSAEDAAGAMLQLSQAMGAGKLNGENLVTIMERMPQLGAAIASEMNVAAGSLYQLGADGKITTEILLNAFNSIAEGAGNLNIEEKLTPAQVATRKYKIATEELAVAFAESLLPVLTPILEGFTGLLTSVTPLVTKFQNLSVEVANLANPFRGLTEQLEAIPGAADAAAQAMQRLVSAALDLIPGLKQVRQAFQIFDFAVQKTNELTGNLNDNKDAAEQLKSPVEEMAESLETVPPPAKELKQAIEDTKEPAESLKKSVVDTATATKTLKKEASEVSSGFKKAEMVVSAELQEALNREVQSLDQIKQQNLDIEAALQNQGMTYRQVNSEKQVGAALTNGIAAGEERAADGADRLFSAQMSANGAIQAGAASAANLASQMERAAAAAASLSGGAAMGGTGYTGGGLTSGYNVTNRDEHFGIDLLGMDRKFAGSSSSKKYATHNPYSIKDGQIVKMDVQERFEAQQAAQLQMKVDRLNAQSRQVQAFDRSSLSADGRYAHNLTSVWQSGGMIGPKGSQRYRDFELMYGGHLGYGTFAEGGYVSGPTQAVIGEGGEPEYVIPASKLDGAMQRYSAGMRGESMIPSSASVSVNYSGSTVDMGGSSYINKGDVTGIVSQAVNQTLTTLQRSSRARLTAGLR
jgi:tape measure domain-containing protein